MFLFESLKIITVSKKTSTTNAQVYLFTKFIIHAYVNVDQTN